jgi:hypothetical protein
MAENTGFWGGVQNMMGTGFEDPKTLGWMNAAASLMQAAQGGQPGTGRVSLGSALGQGMQGYMKGYGSGKAMQAQDLQSQLAKLNMLKVGAELRKLQQQQAMLTMMPGLLGLPSSTETPEMADDSTAPAAPASNGPITMTELPPASPLATATPPSVLPVNPPPRDPAGGQTQLPPITMPAPGQTAQTAANAMVQPQMNQAQRILMAAKLQLAMGNSTEANALMQMYNATRPDLAYRTNPDGSMQMWDQNTGQDFNPTTPGMGNGFLPGAIKPEQMIGEASRWGKDYYQPTVEVMNRFQNVVNLASLDEGGIMDYGLLIGALKSLEPNSAVLQGEAESAGKMRSIAGQMSDILGKFKQGGLGSSEARLQLATLAQTATKVAVDSYNKQADRQRKIYGAAKMSPDAINAILQPMEMPTAAASREALKKELGITTPSPIPAEVQKLIPKGAFTARDPSGAVFYYDSAKGVWIDPLTGKTRAPGQ